MKIQLNLEQSKNALKYFKKHCPEEFKKYEAFTDSQVNCTYDEIGELTISVFDKQTRQGLGLFILSVDSGLDANTLNACLIQDYNRVTKY